jgi:ATP-dependent helicase Lhr and Lhr-like helicase
MMTDPALRRRLPRTWAPFFARFGSLTEVQRAAIPPILDGHNTSVHAATATGKTEAVVAPVLERALAAREETGAWGVVLYIVPTRALCNDLVRRLEGPIHDLGLDMRVRTGDRREVRSDEALPDILVTTPETFDSLLARNPAAFPRVGTVVLDELHLMDGTPRGDQLRVLLERLRRILGDDAPAMHAMSATLRQPQEVSSDYIHDVLPVQVGGQRPVDPIDLRWPEAGGGRELGARLMQEGLKKLLAFTNSRREAETFARALREGWVYGAHVHVHYSNVSRRRREDIEACMQEGPVGMTVATTTLELGIDVGDIEAVVLFGPPPSVSSYLQRVGRSNRRDAVTRVLRLSRDEDEQARFELLHRRAVFGVVEPRPRRPLDPSVIAQQIVSILYQRRRIQTSQVFLAHLFEPLGVDELLLDTLLEHMIDKGHLDAPRPGLLRITDRLLPQIDRGLIHATIGDGGGGIEVIDVDTGRTIGSLEEGRAAFTLGGRSWRSVRRAGRRVYARADGGGGGEGAPGTRGGGAPASPVIARDLRAQRYEVGPDQIPFEHDPTLGTLSVYHHLGGTWRHLLLHALGRRVFLGQVAEQDDEVLVIGCPDPPGRALAGQPVFPDGVLPALSGAVARQIAHRHPFGRHKSFVPPSLLIRHVIQVLEAEMKAYEYDKLRFIDRGA